MCVIYLVCSKIQTVLQRMASSVVLRRHITDITRCPICLEMFDTPVSVPCLHTFCLRCLQHTFAADYPGDVVACPLCRREFRLPVGGLAALPRNFTIEGLVEVCAATRPASAQASVVVTQAVQPVSSCTIASDAHQHVENNVMQNVGENVMPAAEASSGNMNRIKRPLSTPTNQKEQQQSDGLTEDTALTITCGRRTGGAEDEFCFDCHVDVCATSGGNIHDGHRRRRLNDVISECQRRVSGELTRVTDALRANHTALVDVNHRTADILNYLQQKETFTRNECCADDEDEIEKKLRELFAEKDDALRHLAASRELLNIDKMSLETFLKDGSRKLMTATTTAGLLRVVKEVKVETKSLLSVHQIRLDKSKMDGKQQILCTDAGNVMCTVQVGPTYRPRYKTGLLCACAKVRHTLMYFACLAVNTFGTLC